MSLQSDRARLSAAIGAERVADLEFAIACANADMPGADIEGEPSAHARSMAVGQQWQEASLETFRASEALTEGEMERLGIPEWNGVPLYLQGR